MNSNWKYIALVLAMSSAIPALSEQLHGASEPSMSAPKAASSALYQDWSDAQRNRTVPVRIYMPISGSAPYPVVIFSHGLGGSRDAAEYLGEAWSKQGYLCVFVQHEGSDTAVWKSARSEGKNVMQAMQSAANGTNLVSRAGDIKFVLDELEKKNKNDTLLGGKINLNEIAVAGHSFGAGTSLAIAGQTFMGSSKLADSRIKAAIYLCPPVNQLAKKNPEQAFGSIKIPGLLMTGTEDNSPIGGTSAADRPIPFYGISAPHQYLVCFDGADHGVFGGRAFRPPKATDLAFQEKITKITLAFLDSTLKHDSSATQWINGDGATNYLSKIAKFERK